MKTDRFTDIIRRKLESIRPEFTDKDWTRMQSTLRDANVSQPNTPGANQPFSGGIWSGQPWLLAAATISAVVLIAFSVWQHREISQLRQTIAQVHPQPANQPASAPAPSDPGSGEQARQDVAHSDNATLSQPQRESTTSANRNESQAVRPDTVYITRYVPVPSRAKPDVGREERLNQRSETFLEQRYAIEKPKLSPATTDQPTHITNTKQTELYDASSTPSSGTRNTINESPAVTRSTNTFDKNRTSANPTARKRNKKQSDTSPLFPADNQSNVAVDTHATTDTKAPQTEPSVVTHKISANYEPVASLPLSVESKNWGAALTQRAKRMRSAQPAVVPVEQSQAPTSQPVQRVAARFRAGVGGEVASRLWSAGVFTEVLLGRHWTVGLGLSQATYLSTFITEEDFNDRTHRNFRKEFARPGDLWRDILNIDTRQTRLQIPVSLGYRIPLNQSLTLLPTVGTYVSLSNSENVTYYCRDILRPPMQPQPQRGFDEISTSQSQPVDLISSLAFGAGIEWQRGHWVVQGTPVITIPSETSQQAKQTDLNWQKNTTIGLRARLLYQF